LKVTVHRESGLGRKVAGRDAGPTMRAVGPASVPVIKCLVSDCVLREVVEGNAVTVDKRQPRF